MGAGRTIATATLHTATVRLDGNGDQSTDGNDTLNASTAISSTSVYGQGGNDFMIAVAASVALFVVRVPTRFRWYQ